MAFQLTFSSTIYQLFIPANMMFAKYLESCSTIMGNIDGQQSLAFHMHKFASNIKAAIIKYGIVNDPTYGKVYAYEVDGFGSGENT
jgi:meiotically up-regulated gene 157 (Mug157) protein